MTDGTCGSCGAYIDRAIVEVGEPYHGASEDCRAIRAYDPDENKARQELRGAVYLARLRVVRLTHAWPDEDKRTDDQKRAVAEAERGLETVIERARQEGVIE